MIDTAIKRNILITGRNSYIGTSLEKWLIASDKKYLIDSIDMKTDSWEKKIFSSYDTIYHVAGIAHIKEKTKNKDLYFKINRDLAYRTALKAKTDNVKQFIFLSTMGVYGKRTGTIKENTKPFPKSAYGQSKLEAEELIMSLSDSNFKVVILRPPMIYGRNAKGNYNLLSNFAKKSPLFPEYENKRSMLYIDNLSEIVKVIIDFELEGMFFPQNSEYVCTSDLVSKISHINKKNIKLTKIFNPLIRLLLKTSIVSKVFGDLIYDIENDFAIPFTDFYRTLELTED